MDHFFMYGCFEGEAMTPEDVEDMKKYWKYQDNPDDPELKEFGEQYEKKLKKERWEYEKKIYIWSAFYIVVCSALLYLIYSSVTIR